ncbi:cytosolic factor, phosphatidylinositol/phosphatidylcholine transfer protein [Sporothrix eucalyptigena]|uniref:Cytosolic factor, phosphatidylinositol/phosphatidylcholine transfer protein n=1 Tax=Sporothrix eucalyptigena TaxID=1812306 RepID=A0ABP0BPU6_9PEZI
MADAAANGGMELDPKYDNYDFPIVSPNDQSGHPGHLTAEQQAQVHQLRLMLEAQSYTKRLDTLTLLRFLRARKFDVNLAMKMFVDCEAWRKETGLDDLVATWEYPEKEKIFEYYPQYYHKTDRDGRPVYIEALGNIDLTAMYKITTAERMLTNLAVEYERLADPRLPACSRKAGHLLETCCTIMDMKGVGISRAPQVYSYIKQASAMSQNYYPERLGRFYLLNAPWGFSTVWSIIKGWLDPVTVAKIHILGSSYQKELFQQVAPENLPKQFGGSCECEGGCGFSDMGPWREAEWYKPAAWENNGAAAPATDAATAPPTGDATATEGIKLEAPGADAEAAAGAKETAAA